MSKLHIIGSVCGVSPIWIGFLCATLEVCFKVDTHTILIVGVALIGVCLFVLGICSWKASD